MARVWHQYGITMASTCEVLAIGMLNPNPIPLKP